MIAQGYSVKFAAVSLAVVLHIGLAHPWNAEQQVRTEAGAGAVVAKLGNSFVDMTAGVAQPVRPAATHTPETPQPATIMPSITRADPSQNRIDVQETRSVPTQPLSLPVQPNPLLTALGASTPVAADPVKNRIASQPSLMVTPQRPIEVVTAMDPAPERPPQVRPPATERPKPRVKASPPKKTPSRSGNGQPTTVQGAATGQETAKAKRQGSDRATAADTGNARVSNYPGQVMRRIARLRRPDTNVRGTAVISFTIASNGQLASAHVARSSGSAALDSAAIRIVQRAAPFPPPPAGARRSHSVGIKGRG